MGLFNFPQVDSNVNVIFSVDGDEYAVEQFKIDNWSMLSEHKM